jgi:hypothetical protein
MPLDPQKPEFIPSTMLRNNPGMIRDCYWDGDYFVIRQIMADPANGQDGMKIKIFRLGPDEWPKIAAILEAELNKSRI